MHEGEWVLAVVELGPKGRALSAAARVSLAPDGAKLVFEPRDWQRLVEFAAREAVRTPKEPPSSGETLKDDWVSLERPRPVEAQAAGGMEVVCEQADVCGPPSGVKGAALKILVVDDDEDLRGLLTVLLEAGGLRVLAVESAEEALARMESEAISLLILDWNLPRMSGIDLCRRLRAQPNSTRLPILFLTAHSEAADVEEAFESGADDYLAKPFRAPELRARIFCLLRSVDQQVGHSA